MFLLLLGIGLLLPQVACVDVAETDTGGNTTLYVFDGASDSVLAWDDFSAMYDSGAADAAQRTITSGKLAGLTLGGAGMAMDSSRQRLYLVASNGTVVRIDRIEQQSGSVSTADILSFNLDDDGTDISGGVFGQAAVSPTGDTLYVTETSVGGDKTQLWAIPTSMMYEGLAVTESLATVFGKTSVTGDRNGTGVAAASGGVVYAYFQAGDTVSSGGSSYDGPRLRKGSSAGFATASNVIVGSPSVTLLGKYGCLAYDTRNDRLYFARHNTEAGVTGNPLLVYLPGDLGAQVDFQTGVTIPGPDDLRMISHAGGKDWLVGAGTSQSANLYIWKAPAPSGTYATLTLSGVQIQGLALDGSD